MMATLRRPIQELMSLKGCCALISGGAGHLGLMTAETLIELGATVSILDIDAAFSGKEVPGLTSILDNGAVPISCDLADEQATREAVRNAVSEMGKMDILVHCAAYVGTTDIPGWNVPFGQQTVDAWDSAMRVNVTSAFVMVQEAQRALIASGRGSVISFASTYGLVGPDSHLYKDTVMANPAGYGASKGGLLQLTRYLATTLAPDVRVNAISPGGIWREPAKVFEERYVARTPLARMAKEEDLKGAVAYLASDLSSYVTGHNLVVDGGWTVW